MLMDAPWVLERVVVADSASYLPSEKRWEGLAEGKSQWWFEPIRQGLIQWFELEGKVPESGGKKRIVYLQVQDDDNAKLRLSDASHRSLRSALGSLSSSYDVKVISTSDDSTSWRDRMYAILGADVVISVHGGHIMDATYMKPTDKSVVVELFPEGSFDGEYAAVMKELGFHWQGWAASQYVFVTRPLCLPNRRPENSH